MKTTYGPTIDYHFCNGCAECYEDCPMDIYNWDKEKKRPIVAYPDECQACCICELACPERAIDVKFPLHAKIDFGIYPDANSSSRNI